MIAATMNQRVPKVPIMVVVAALLLFLDACYSFSTECRPARRRVVSYPQKVLMVASSSSNHENQQQDDKIDHDDEDSSSSSPDWLLAEFTLLHAPSEPSPDLSPATVALTVCRSLQWVDRPEENAGLERCFPFLTFECRKAVTARQGAQTIERFCQYGLLSPALQPFMGATRVDLDEDQGTYTVAQPPTRGALMSYPVSIRGADILTLHHPSGKPRHGVAAEPPVTQMVLRLEQQRRPPFQGCWLVREILNVRHAFAGDMGNAHIGG